MNLETKIQKYKHNLALFEVYGPLLSMKKKAYMSAYFFDNLSLREIANIYKVSHATVHQAINEALKELEKYEKKLKFIKKQHLRVDFIKNNVKDKDIISRYIELEFGQEK